MSRKNSQYSSAAAWRDAAMQRISKINDGEADQRSAIADA